MCSDVLVFSSNNVKHGNLHLCSTAMLLRDGAGKMLNTGCVLHLCNTTKFNFGWRCKHCPFPRQFHSSSVTPVKPGRHDFDKWHPLVVAAINTQCGMKLVALVVPTINTVV